jgi:hypothetical protein
VILLGLIGAAWWGYTRRADVTEYAVAAMMEQALGEMVPPGVDQERVARRIAALIRAFKEGRVDPERLRGMGEMLRTDYADRKLDHVEFESLLSFAEASVER